MSFNKRNRILFYLYILFILLYLVPLFNLGFNRLSDSGYPLALLFVVFTLFLFFGLLIVGYFTTFRTWVQQDQDTHKEVDS